MDISTVAIIMFAISINILTIIIIDMAIAVSILSDMDAFINIAYAHHITAHPHKY